MKIKRRTLTSLRAWTIRISLLIIIFGVCYIYMRSDIFTITSYDVQGVDQNVRNQIDSQLHELAKKKTFRIIPNNKIFTYSNSGIINVVRTNVSEVATIDIRPVGLHTVRIHITLLTPLFRLSNSEALTENGIIFSTAKDLSQYPHIVIASSTRQVIKIKGLSFNALTMSDPSIDTQFLQNLALLGGKVSSLIFPVAGIVIESTGDVTLFDVQAKSKVMFLKDVDQKKLWSTLVSALDTDPLKSKLATEKDRLLYLDARYGNKVFYRFSDMSFQNGGSAAIMDNHATSSQGTSTEVR